MNIQARHDLEVAADEIKREIDKIEQHTHAAA